MERKKSLVLWTAATALLVFCAVAIYQAKCEAIPIEMHTGGFLSIGKASAPVEIVLIEDFRCRNCCAFSEKILPKIQAEYVKSGKARFTLVPVSFLSGSQAVANAALEVYQNHPDRFFPYLKEILNQAQEGEVRSPELIRLARRIGGIDLARLHTAIEKGSHNKELEKNLEWAQTLMGARFKTPAIYINGVSSYTFTYQGVSEQIDRILGQKP
ncbi:MAG TPA: thioredoxin domain-containing protein [Chlamydiales bacterium]|nr:thioredoxin domain-containing protein [Chlamydiales bacterium]